MGSPASAARRAYWIAWALGGGAIALGLSFAPRPAPLVLFNATPSEPLGWYRLTGEPLRVGVLAAFKPPPAAQAFMQGPRLSSFLKMVAAGPGSLVCASGGVLAVEGDQKRAVARHDGRGRLLPRWNGCRRLGSGEWFLLSDRVPNSFDSRYFGPIGARDVLGVYTPFSVAAGGEGR